MIKRNLFGNARMKMPMNLQFFAEDGNGGGAGGGGGTGSGDGAGAGSAGAEGTPGAEGTQNQDGQNGTSFDDFLKDSKNQAEFDRRVAKALETQRGKMQQDMQTQIANAKTEAEKLAKMNAEQKAEYEKQKKEQELADREAQITKRELSATAKETLADKGLPTQLAEILNYSSAEACQASIDAVEKAFQEAVTKAVDEKLRGGNPPKKAQGAAQVFTKEQIAAMTPEEINKNWDAVQASMKNGI